MILQLQKEIIFSKDITLLYGNNGSGKSSYFRILNEIIGGNQKTELRPNIYASTDNPINIRLTYAEGDSIKELLWDGTTRAVSPLNLSSVFDSNYTMAFLQKRSADTAIVLPYGLHLFTSLTTAMDNIKGRIQTEIDGILSSLPQINTEGLSDDVNTKNISYISEKFPLSDPMRFRHCISRDVLIFWRQVWSM